MKQSVIFVLALISLSSINAGVIRDEHICYNKEGKEIPCKKFISTKEDFGIKGHSKRDWSYGNGEFNIDNWLNRNRFNALSIKNAINQNRAANYNGDSNNYNSNYNNNYNSNYNNNYNSNYNNNYNTNRYNNNNYNNNFNGNFNANNWFNNLSALLSSLSNFSNSLSNSNSNFNVNVNSNSNSNANSNNNSNNNNWWSNWIDQSNENNWWKFGNWWNSDNSFGNTYGDFSSDVRIVSNDNVIVSTKITKTIGSKPTSISTKNIPLEHRTTKAAVPTATAPAKTSVPTSAPTEAASTSNSPVNLPIKAFTMTRFNNCSEEQAKILESLIEDIKTYRAASVYLLDNQDEDETYKKIFLKYFKSEDTYSRVKETFNNINDMASATAYCEPHYDEACASGAMAWTYLDSREFHVCPSMFEDAMFGTISKRSSEAASIVLHELTHCHGTDDYAYGERGSTALPAYQASNNADTFRLFSMSSIYYLNEKFNGLTKRSDDFLNESIDFRSEPFKDKVVVRPSLGKRNDDFLNESIDFRSEPFKDKVVIRPVLGKRGDDFLSETIDFRSEPFKDAVRVRPNPNQ